MRNTKTGEDRRVELEKGEFIGVVGDYINSEELVVKIFTKEMKKVRPYFEMEIVKIKKPRYQSREVIKFMGKKYEVFIEDGEVSIKKHKHQKKKGNWVNGENLDKIKFPCFCSYIKVVTGEKRYGKIDKNWDDIAYKDKYQISKIINQSDEISVLYEDVSLKKLMINLKIKILKGKIIIFEEE